MQKEPRNMWSRTYKGWVINLDLLDEFQDEDARLQVWEIMEDFFYVVVDNKKSKVQSVGQIFDKKEPALKMFKQLSEGMKLKGNLKKSL